jgi:diacylglycerol kinase family enzyme
MDQSALPIVINRSGGTATALGEGLGQAVEKAFAQAGLPVALHLVDGSALSHTLAGLAGSPVVAVGGGDGTLGHAAGLLAAAGQAMAILPLGTRNHLARQLAIPDDLEGAARVIAAGRRQRIDLAHAGDRIFVNNASLGLYARLVRDREAVVARAHAPKWLANIPAAWHVLAHLRSHPLDLEIDGERHSIATPLLFIGNNRYLLSAGEVGTRDSLSDGELSFYAVAARTPLQLLAMALRTLIGRGDPARDFAALTTGRRATLRGRSHLDVACDGEVARMALPLDLEIMPGALEVVVP